MLKHRPHLHLSLSPQSMTVKWSGGARSQCAGAAAPASPKTTPTTEGNENALQLSGNLCSGLPLNFTQSAVKAVTEQVFPHVFASLTSRASNVGERLSSTSKSI